jgi:KDO2-lipid IV(A) lauroyltransferase
MFQQLQNNPLRDRWKQCLLRDFPNGFEKVLEEAIASAFRLLGRIPRKKAMRLGRAVGRLWFFLDRRHRKVALNNLTYVFGCEKSPVEVRQMAEQVFANTACILFEIGWAYRAESREIIGSIRFDGLENLRQAMKKEKGVLVLTGHLGSWELLVAAIGVLGYPASIVYRPFDFRPLDSFFHKFRGRFRARLLPKYGAAKGILKALRRKELVGILLDQNAGRAQGVFVDFFGKTACTNRGLALMAQRTGAPVVPVFLVREGCGYRMDAGPEVGWIATGDPADDISVNTRRYNQVLESYIRRYPEQWFWVHRRWKTRPAQID